MAEGLHEWQPAPGRRTWRLAALAGLVLASALGAVFYRFQGPENAPAAPTSPIVSYRVNPRRLPIRLYWKDEHGQLIRSLGNLSAWLARRREKLLFATNGGMFHRGNAPVGLFIRERRLVTPLDTAAGAGNFYLRPNGVFYLRADRTAGICRTPDFDSCDVAHATQSGPMLVIDGQINPAFRPGSANLNIRNGVGILPGGDVLFAMSKRKINFHDFAAHFRRLGCQQALYLDGVVSRTYLPAQGWTQTDGDFGVIIGVAVAADTAAAHGAAVGRR